jgi:hypothetical protein
VNMTTHLHTARIMSAYAMKAYMGVEK